MRLFERFSRHLEQHPFHPPWYLRGAHLQTVIGSQLQRRFPPPHPQRRSEDVEIAPGVAVRTTQVLQERPSPTIIVLHGMTGSEESGYMQGLSRKAWAQGWSCLLPNLYNVHPRPPRPVIFHAASSDLVGKLLQVLKRKHHLEEVYLAGVSLGANLLLKLLGEWGEQTPEWVRAAAVASPLTDLSQSWQLMERASNRIYQIYFVNRLKTIARNKAGYLNGHVDLNKLARIRTIRDFDNVCTAVVGGWRDAFEYYQEASSVKVVNGIRVPTAVVHAEDDPFLPSEPLTRPAFQDNRCIYVHFTQRGGHLGFIQAPNDLDPDRHWEESRILHFFNLVQGQ